ncbi:TetR/AcrR family transcriptional regulator [Renibacterium salmoninarum]|nr:TetR/AcrR family transcriptional regulator [Renibacterium salmoninarum]
MTADPRQRRAARNAQASAASPRPKTSKEPITVERITAAALELISTKGYEAMTMRSVASALNTGPASLYAHVVNKADIDELIIGHLCTELRLPEPNVETWRAQITNVCQQLRDQYLRYPGVSRAAMSMVVTNLDVLRVNEGMLAILVAGGIDPQRAAWAIDALFLYVTAYTLEIALTTQRSGQTDPDDNWAPSREEADEVQRRFSALPADQFPQTRRYAVELTSGAGRQRFDFTLGLMLDHL